MLWKVVWKKECLYCSGLCSICCCSGCTLISTGFLGTTSVDPLHLTFLGSQGVKHHVTYTYLQEGVCWHCCTSQLTQPCTRRWAAVVGMLPKNESVQTFGAVGGGGGFNSLATQYSHSRRFEDSNKQNKQQPRERERERERESKFSIDIETLKPVLNWANVSSRT